LFAVAMGHPKYGQQQRHGLRRARQPLDERQDVPGVGQPSLRSNITRETNRVAARS
jgi:hypothetical protein